MRKTLSTDARFWAKVEVADGGCWLWKARSKSNGYGQFSIGGKNNRTYRVLYAHRYAYERLVGPIAEGKELDHLCRVRACVNPAHLEVVTHQQNMLRGEGVTAQAARRTHCIHGHSFDLFNTKRRKDGARLCRACHRENARKHRQKVKANASIVIS